MQLLQIATVRPVSMSNPWTGQQVIAVANGLPIYSPLVPVAVRYKRRRIPVTPVATLH